jgi:lipopolysaccharide biosynthesis regulator YciM
MSEPHLSAEEAIKAIPTSESTALLEAQVYLAFEDSSKAIETLQAYFNQNSDALKKVEPHYSDLIESIKTGKVPYEDLQKQLRPIEEAMSVNGCGECPTPTGPGYWVYNAFQKKWVCVFCG